MNDKQICNTQKDQNLHVLEGKEYVVYGITIFEGQIFYYICDETYTCYPLTEPFNLFEKVDSRPSRFWIITASGGPGKNFKIMFPEWINEFMFATNLVDGDEREMQILRLIRRLWI